VVDRYGDWLVMQCLTLGMAARRDEIAGLLAEMLAPAGIYARDDADVRRQEGLALETGPAAAAPPGGATSLAAVERAEKEARAAKLREAAQAHPNIQQASRLLEADVAKIEEL
jgi:23S rRNA (cytosine1962-C5)-methyltransferase